MTRTLRLVQVDIGSVRERIGRDDFERQARARRRHLSKGTPAPWPTVTRTLAEVAATRPGSFEVREVYDVDVEHDLHEPPEAAQTVPVQRVFFEPPPLPPPDDDIGTRTLMGIGARAVRATAKSGEVEARPATREPRATPDAPYSQAMRASIDGAPAPKVEVALHASVEPPYLPPGEIDAASTAVDAPMIAPEASVIVATDAVPAPAAPALAAPPLRQRIAAPEREAEPRARRRERSRAETARPAATAYQALAVGVVSVAAGGLAAYLAMLAF